MKTWIPLENNPEVMTALAHTLGLSSSLSFHDIYSFIDPDLLALIPRPVYALLVTISMTSAWNAFRIAEDSPKPPYSASGPEEPVVWFKQTIGHACGSIGLLHSLMNGPASAFIIPGTDLAKLLSEAIPLKQAERAQLLHASEALEKAHGDAAAEGDTKAPEDADWIGNHFVAFVKGKDGHLYELEGSRKGPLDRGVLGDDEDVLSANALKLGIGRYIEMEKAAGGMELRLSALALAQNPE